MPLESALPPVAQRVAELNTRYRHHSATAVLEHAVGDPMVGAVALVSSFGAESVVLLHMLSVIDRGLPVIFLDTEMLFPETLEYQREVAAKLRLDNVRVIRPEREEIFAQDPDGLLHQSNPDACCSLRKVLPLRRALKNFDAWITGRKRFQGGVRASLEFFEADGTERIKVNPLAYWSPQDVQDYMINNRLPRHPLTTSGFASIGCKVCTTPVGGGESQRAGRWRGRSKQECGIHISPQGRVVRDMNGASPVIVRDEGFFEDDWADGFESLQTLQKTRVNASALDIDPATDPDMLKPLLPNLPMIRITFPAYTDGRGFTLARLLRLLGFSGRLRAAGPLTADQYAMARRAGFDEVEIPPEIARRQPEAQWLARANWQRHDYQSRLRGAV